jgi:hypothetical protein
MGRRRREAKGRVLPAGAFRNVAPRPVGASRGDPRGPRGRGGRQGLGPLQLPQGLLLRLLLAAAVLLLRPDPQRAAAWAARTDASQRATAVPWRPAAGGAPHGRAAPAVRQRDRAAGGHPGRLRAGTQWLGVAAGDDAVHQCERRADGGDAEGAAAAADRVPAGAGRVDRRRRPRRGGAVCERGARAQRDDDLLHRRLARRPRVGIL